MSKFTCLVVCVAAVSFSGVYAATEEEKAAFREAFKPIMAKCSQPHGVTEDDIKTATKANSADGINPCFIGCVLKSSGVLNAQGLYDLEAGLSKIKEYIKNEADRAKFEEIGKTCLSVNDQAVNDGEAGCERAKLLLTCFLENKAKFPL